MQPVKIFQIHYRKDQRRQLDAAFVPYDNAGDTSPLLEFNVFRKIAAAGLADDAALWGAVSWKFTEKTGLNGGQLLEVLERNPGYDVYFCNPFPETESIYPNLWNQGETAHPHFVNLASDFLEAAELSPRVVHDLMPPSHFSAANYFIGTHDFWQEYLAFVDGAFIRAQERLLPAARAVIFSSLADRRGLHAQATYLPFFIERLFPVFLMQAAGQRFRAFKYAARSKTSPPANAHLATLAAMKERAIASQDNWLAGCWANYRDAYCALAYGREWTNHFFGPSARRLAFPSALAAVVVQAAQETASGE